MQNHKWEHFHHGADIGVRGYGRSLEEAFENAALALTAVVAPLDSILPNEEIPLEASGEDIGILFVDWLDAVIYAMATRRMLFSNYRVRIEGKRLHGKAWGEAVDPQRHQPAVEIKGATFTELKVEQGQDGIWIAQCVVDV